jgi:peptide/nickel transport system substrate-binding protein
MNVARSAKYRLPSFLILLSLIATLLAACGGSASTPAATTAPSDSGSTNAPAATAAPAPTAVVLPTAVGSTELEEGLTGGTMTGAWIGPCCVNVDNVNPLSAGGDYHWINKVFSHLVTYNVEYTEIVGELADSWEVSEDSLTWTFKLREGVKWHDGSDFTADDVQFSLDICLNPLSGPCTKAGQLVALAGGKDVLEGNADSIAGIEVIDAHTIALTTEAPNASLLDTLTEVWIVHKASLADIPADQLAGSDYWKTKAIGTGPFKLSKYEAGQYMELVRNEDYWRGAPLLEKLIRRQFQDPATALLAFERGEIDFAYVTADEVQRLAENPKAILLPGPSQVDNAITMNPNKNPAFANPKFRQAILYAINRASIIENLYNGAATPVSCLYGNPLYIPADINPYEYNPEKALAILAEEGIDPAAIGPIVMDTYYNDQLSLDVMTAIQQDLAGIGLTIELQQMDSASWNKRYYDDLDSQMTFLGGANGADPNRAYGYYYSIPQRSNPYKFNSPELDALLDAGAAEMDPEARALIYQDACRVMSEELPWIFLWETQRYGVVSDRIGNFLYTPAAGGGSYYDQAEKWFIRN